MSRPLNALRCTCRPSAVSSWPLPSSATCGERVWAPTRLPLHVEVAASVVGLGPHPCLTCLLVIDAGSPETLTWCPSTWTAAWLAVRADCHCDSSIVGSWTATCTAGPYGMAGVGCST
jgi:hypothetical protein